LTQAVTELLREGTYIAEVRVNLIPDNGAWGPYFSLEDAEKLSRVQCALRMGDIEAAKRDAEVFEVTPVGAPVSDMDRAKDMSRLIKDVIREGRFVAEIAIRCEENGSPWSPVVVKEDEFKADRVRAALRRGDVAAARQDALLFELADAGQSRALST
jgi:hypothetical protein